MKMHHVPGEEASHEKLDLGLAVLLTLVGVALLAVLILALMAFAPVLLSLASAWIAWTEWRRTRHLGRVHDNRYYRWLAWFWWIMLWSILIIATVLIVSAWLEYALIYNEIKVAVVTAWQKYTWPYLLMFGGVFFLVLLIMAAERSVLSIQRWWQRRHSVLDSKSSDH